MLSGRGFSTFQLVLGPNLVGPSGWGAEDGDLLLAHDLSPPAQFARRRKLRTMAREGVLEEVSDSGLRKLSGRDSSFRPTGVRIGGPL